MCRLTHHRLRSDPLRVEGVVAVLSLDEGAGPEVVVRHLLWLGAALREEKSLWLHPEWWRWMRASERASKRAR